MNAELPDKPGAAWHSLAADDALARLHSSAAGLLVLAIGAALFAIIETEKQLRLRLSAARRALPDHA